MSFAGLQLRHVDRTKVLGMLLSLFLYGVSSFVHAYYVSSSYFCVWSSGQTFVDVFASPIE